MHWDNKVVWSEGMFLRPQHFQQFDRYVERLVRGRAEGLAPHCWGVFDLQINRELLSIGKFALLSCRGILEDGTPFGIPVEVDHPPPIDIPDNARNCLVYLALPARQPGSLEVALNGQEGNTRYSVSEFDAADTTLGGPTEEQIQVGKLRLRYVLETSERAGLVCLGLARIIEMRSDKSVILDERYIAPCLNTAAQSQLSGYIEQLEGWLHIRGEELAGRYNAPGAQGAAAFSDFLLLQLVNRYEPLLVHYRTDTAALHPATLYAKLLEMAGELATFTKQTKRTASFPEYRHDDLQHSFEPLMADIEVSLASVRDPNAISIPLKENKQYGVHIGSIKDHTLFANAVFVLVAAADMPSETLRRNVTNLVKVGPVEKLRPIVDGALTGIRLDALPVAPRQLPFHAGSVYFELGRGTPMWKDMERPGGTTGLGIFVGDNFPGLSLELWAIRS